MKKIKTLLTQNRIKKMRIKNNQSISSKYKKIMFKISIATSLNNNRKKNNNQEIKTKITLKMKTMGKLWLLLSQWKTSLKKKLILMNYLKSLWVLLKLMKSLTLFFLAISASCSKYWSEISQRKFSVMFINILIYLII